MARPTTLLSPRKLQVYNFILKFKKTHDGNSPSVNEICQHCGLKSTSLIRFYLVSLERLGLIKRDESSGARNIEVVGGAWIAPAMPVVLNETDAHELLEVVKR